MAAASENKKSLFKRLLPLFLLLLTISPILFSLSIHSGILYLSSRITWSFGEETDTKQEAPVVIVLDGKKDDGLKFQGTDQLDSFRTQEKMAYPRPEIEYRTVAPDVDFYPDARVNEELDIISIEAAAMDHKWVNPSTGRQPLYTGPERFVGSFSRHIQVLREGGLDVVFIFDATSSMANFLKEVKLKIENFALTLKKIIPTCRIGFVAYRDYDDYSDFVTRVHPLTYGTLSFHDFLVDINARGGADREEAVYDALKAAVLDMKWNQKSKKIILIIGDAPPHYEDMQQALELVEKFRKDMGGTVAALDTRKPEYYKSLVPAAIQNLSSEDYRKIEDDQSVLEEFQTLAQAGGGEFARLENEEKVIKSMLLLIFGARWEMYLGEFMKNL